MAEESVNVALRLRGAREFNAATSRSSHALGRFGDSTGRTRQRLRAMGRAARYGAIALGGFTIVAGKKAVQASSDLNEEINKSEQVFRKSGKGLIAWSEGTATSLGLSQRAALQGASSIGAMLVPMGLARGKAARMSQTMATLGADMASFNNEDPTAMLDRIRAGLSGEAEPLKRFGAVLLENRVSQFAWNHGLAKSGVALTEQQKILSRYNLLLQDTKVQHGDAGKTGKAWAGVQRRLSAVTEDLLAKVGNKLVPFLEKAGNALIPFVEGLKNGKGPGGEFADVMTNLWKGIEPVAKWFVKGAKAIGGFVAEHPKLVGFGVALFGLKKAAGGLTPSLFSGGGLRGGSGFVGGFKGGMGQFFGAKFGQWFLSKYGSKFRLAGAGAGTQMGTAAGPAAGTATGSTFVGSAKGGALRGKFRTAGGILGPLLGIAIAVPLIDKLNSKLDEWSSDRSPGGALSMFSKLMPGSPNFAPQELPGDVRGLIDGGGGSKRKIPYTPVNPNSNAPRHGRGASLRTPRASAGRFRAAGAMAGGGSGGPTVLHNHFHVDGKEVLHSVTRRDAAARARA